MVLGSPESMFGFVSFIVTGTGSVSVTGIVNCGRGKVRRFQIGINRHHNGPIYTRLPVSQQASEHTTRAYGFICFLTALVRPM